nr:hypothetical protein [uncultured Psychroserpens sp.]
MKTNKKCKHCYQLFESRRSNHVYCTTSCKTKASYKRNNYTYISGHFKKPEDQASDQLSVPMNKDVVVALQALENKIQGLSQNKSISSTSVKEAAFGTITADVGTFAVKKLFAPKTLPATKGDIESLKEELKQLKKALMLNRGNKFPTNF